MDDSGTRHPDRPGANNAVHGNDWFALGGILLEESREAEARQLHSDFCAKWRISNPLHSSEIRARSKKFAWIRTMSHSERDKFHEDLTSLLLTVPVIGIACVVDRPGYNLRYRERYKNERWRLCKTAFSVVVERSAKYAKSKNSRLRVMPERCNKRDDIVLKNYYDALRRDGMPFDAATSSQYSPLSAADFRFLLFDFRTKFKTSPMAQLADLYLWPICMGGYDSQNRAYQQLLQGGKLIECVLEAGSHPHLATKYSCFDSVRPKP